MSAVIEVKNLQKYFSTPKGMLHAVDGVTMKIGAGRTMGVVGESGCGKSTLGRTIIHLQESTGGQIFFKGEDVTHVNAAKQNQLKGDMQIIFQDPYSSLNPRMTVEETIRELLLKIHKEGPWDIILGCFGSNWGIFITTVSNSTTLSSLMSSSGALVPIHVAPAVESMAKIHWPAFKRFAG